MRSRAARLPNLLGIGAAKAGTTWLAGLMAAHPQVYMPAQKELNALHYEDLDQRLGEYMAYFDRAAGEPIRCDFSVRYLASPRAAGAAARLTPDAKLLLIVRNPIDQIQSHYWHLRRQNFHQAAPVTPAPDLFEALERFPELLLEPALYGKHIERWLRLFPEAQLLVLDHEELKGDLDGTMARVCDFIGVDRMAFSEVATEISAQDGRAGVQPRNRLAAGVFPTVYTGIARGPYAWAKRVLGVRGAEALKRRLRLREMAEGAFFRPGYPKLDEDGRRRLHAKVAEDSGRLAAILGRDLSAWRPPL
jgi:hypothetical protein